MAIRDGFEFIAAMLESKKDWLDATDDAHDVVSFYKSQLPTWKRLLAALTAFADNREILVKSTESAKALATLEAIRGNPAPYGQIPQIDGLIQTIQGINDVAVVQHREQAIKRVDALIAEVIKTLDKVQAGSDLRNQALLPLQELKVNIGGLASIPRIRYQEEQAGNLLDEAMLAIERATAPPPSPPTATPPGTPPAATVKPPRPSKVIHAAEFAQTIYLESEAEVETYIDKLKTELLGAIRSGHRARIK